MIKDSRNSMNFSKFSEKSFKTCAVENQTIIISANYILPLFAYVALREAELEALRLWQNAQDLLYRLKPDGFWCVLS